MKVLSHITEKPAYNLCVFLPFADIFI